MSDSASDALSKLISTSKPNVFRNLSSSRLVEQSLRRNETKLASNGALVGETGKRTGRSPKDKFIVKDSITSGKVNWNANQAISPEQFDSLYKQVLQYLGSKDLFVQQLFAGADAQYRLSLQVVNEYAWH